VSDHLLRALSAMLPNADTDLISSRPWHSLTFSGMQFSIRLALSGPGRSINADKFTRELSERNFDLPDGLVADIAVTEKYEEDNVTHLTIHALLLDD
jgi:hypothetical protein